MVVLLVLAPIFEADFHPNSFGFRPQRSAHQAMDAIIQALRQGKLEVVDADLSKYFDTIPHARLLKLVARRISDGSILHLLRQWLDAPIVEEERGGKRRVLPNRQGVPQGGVISPLLANLYLNALDWAVNNPQEPGHPALVRYADDFVILCAPGQGTELMGRLRRWLEARGLKLNEEKTRKVHSRDGFNFLGFSVRWQRSRRSGRCYAHIEPSAKSRQRLRDKVREQLNHWTLHRRIPEAVGGPEQAAARLEWIFPLPAKHARVRQNPALGAGPVAPLVVAQAQLHQGAVERLSKRVAARPLWSVATAYACIVESSLDRPSECLVMKHPGKPDTGNPSVRFDEGSESDGHWHNASHPVGSGLLY